MFAQKRPRIDLPNELLAQEAGRLGVSLKRAREAVLIAVASGGAVAPDLFFQMSPDIWAAVIDNLGVRGARALCTVNRSFAQFCRTGYNGESIYYYFFDKMYGADERLAFLAQLTVDVTPLQAFRAYTAGILPRQNSARVRFTTDRTNPRLRRNWDVTLLPFITPPAREARPDWLEDIASRGLAMTRAGGKKRYLDANRIAIGFAMGLISSPVVRYGVSGSTDQERFLRTKIALKLAQERPDALNLNFQGVLNSTEIWVDMDATLKPLWVYLGEDAFWVSGPDAERWNTGGLIVGADEYSLPTPRNRQLFADNAMPIEAKRKPVEQGGREEGAQRARAAFDQAGLPPPGNFALLDPQVQFELIKDLDRRSIQALCNASVYFARWCDGRIGGLSVWERILFYRYGEPINTVQSDPLTVLRAHALLYAMVDSERPRNEMVQIDAMTNLPTGGLVFRGSQSTGIQLSVRDTIGPGRYLMGRLTSVHEVLRRFKKQLGENLRVVWDGDGWGADITSLSLDFDTGSLDEPQRRRDRAVFVDFIIALENRWGIILDPDNESESAGIAKVKTMIHCDNRDCPIDNAIADDQEAYICPEGLCDAVFCSAQCMEQSDHVCGVAMDQCLKCGADLQSCEADLCELPDDVAEKRELPKTTVDIGWRHGHRRFGRRRRNALVRRKALWRLRNGPYWYRYGRGPRYRSWWYSPFLYGYYGGYPLIYGDMGHRCLHDHHGTVAEGASKVMAKSATRRDAIRAAEAKSVGADDKDARQYWLDVANYLREQRQ